MLFGILVSMFTILHLGYDFSNEILLIRRKFHSILRDKLILSPDLDVSSDILHLIFNEHSLYLDVD